MSFHKEFSKVLIKKAAEAATFRQSFKLIKPGNVAYGTLDKQPLNALPNDGLLTPSERFCISFQDHLQRWSPNDSMADEGIAPRNPAKDMEDDWKFYREPIVRQRRGHLWPVDGNSEKTHEDTESWQFQAECLHANIVSSLEQQDIVNIVSIDLDKCSRRDIGEWAIVCTMRTSAHGTRVAGLLRRQIRTVDNVKCFINAVPDQQWIVVRVGPIVIHFMTKEDRDKYTLETMYMTEGSPIDFPDSGASDCSVLDISED